MLKVSREEIMQLYETQAVEFKKSLSLKKEGFEALAAMVNSDYAKGLVVFGIAPNGEPEGVEPGDLDSIQRTLADHIRSRFDPPLICNIEIWECEGSILVAVSSERLKNTPYHDYDGRTYIREGSSKRRLSVEERRGLVKKRGRDQHNGPWKCDKCGRSVGMLASVVITDQGAKRTFECPCGGEYWPA